MGRGESAFDFVLSKDDPSFGEKDQLPQLLMFNCHGATPCQCFDCDVSKSFGLSTTTGARADDSSCAAKLMPDINFADIFNHDEVMTSDQE
jgi:hypothetical protein